MTGGRRLENEQLNTGWATVDVGPVRGWEVREGCVLSEGVGQGSERKCVKAQAEAGLATLAGEPPARAGGLSAGPLPRSCPELNSAMREASSSAPPRSQERSLAFICGVSRAPV